jgi:hypothetical protein
LELIPPLGNCKYHPWEIASNTPGGKKNNVMLCHTYLIFALPHIFDVMLCHTY